MAVVGRRVMAYRDLPAEHYHRVAIYRDSVAACLVIDPSLVDGHHVSQVSVEGCFGHVLGDIITVCRIYRSNPTEALIKTIEWNELVRLVQLADAGEAWRWYSEYYARALNYLIRLERAYFSLANPDQSMFA